MRLHSSDNPAPKIGMLNKRSALPIILENIRDHGILRFPDVLIYFWCGLPPLPMESMELKQENNLPAEVSMTGQETELRRPLHLSRLFHANEYLNPRSEQEIQNRNLGISKSNLAIIAMRIRFRNHDILFWLRASEVWTAIRTAQISRLASNYRMIFYSWAGISLLKFDLVVTAHSKQIWTLPM